MALKVTSVYYIWCYVGYQEEVEGFLVKGFILIVYLILLQRKKGHE